ncbi:MAG: SLC13 family permease, partial [Xanthomonadales bacterium]|nr:SLC13 family permease [Xanthomonadales bacterium]
ATRLPPVAIFLGALTLSVTFDLAPLDRSLAGFANPGVLTIGALFAVAAGMYSTGAISLLSERLIGRPKSVLVAQLKILPPIAFGSAFLNNTPLVAMMIPVLRDLCRSTGLSKAKLYIPLSFASILGGTCTLIGTATNLIIAGLVLDALSSGAVGNAGLREIKMFDPSFVAVPAAILGLVLMIATSKWLLQDRGEVGATLKSRRRFGAEFTIPEGSQLAGQTLEAAGFAEPVGYELLEIIRRDGSQAELAPGARFEIGDVLRVSTDLETLADLWTMNGLAPFKTLHPIKAERHDHQLVEVVISPQSPAVGRKVSEFPHPDSPYRMTLVAMCRDEQPIPGRIDDVRIEVGDVAVVEVGESFFFVNRDESHFSLVKRVPGFEIKRWDKALIATVITVAMITAAAFGWLSMLNAAMLATGAMLLTGCMTLGIAARSIDYATLGVLAAAIGLAAAVTQSGLAADIADLLNRMGGGDPHVALAVIFVGRVIMANLITNTASAVFIFPIALSIADQLGVNFMPFAIALMTGTVGATIIPASYQTNLMVYGPGDYKVMDFVKMGLPLTIVVGLVTIFLAPIFFPFAS